MTAFTPDLPLPLDNNPIPIGSGKAARVRIHGVPISSVAAIVDPKLEGEWVLRHGPDARDPIDILGTGSVHLGESVPVSEGTVFSVAGFYLEIRGGQLRVRSEDLKGLAVSVRNLSAAKRDGTPLLDNVSFDIAPGEFVGLLGPSGCGKSSLIQRMLNLTPRTSGRILFNGRDVGEEPDSVLPLAAYLPQHVERMLHDGLTVRQEIDDFVRIHLAPDPERKALERKLLDAVFKLDENRCVKDLSGGEQRRLALLLALLRRPRILLLDEPTAGFDPGLEATVFKQLESLARNEGLTILCATHATQEATRFDRVLLFAKDGRLVAAGHWANCLGGDSPQALFERLSSDSGSAATGPTAESEPAADLPPATPRASFGRTLRGYLERVRHTALSLRKRTGLGVLLNDVGLPVIVALVVDWTCGRLFEENRGLLCFCCALALFYFGLAGSVRSFVSERVPGRCLENLARVPLAAYFTSHLIRTAGRCLVQTAAFLLPLHPFVLDDTTLRAALVPEAWLVLFGVALLGGATGLLVSAWTRKEQTAVATIPILAILALLFSEPVVGDVEPGRTAGQANSGEPSRTILVSVVRNFTPCHHARYVLDNRLGAGLEVRNAVELDKLNTDEQRRTLAEKIEKNYGRQLAVSRPGFLRTFACGLILLLIGAFVGESVRENKWDGRANE